MIEEPVLEEFAHEEIVDECFKLCLRYKANDITESQLLELCYFLGLRVVKDDFGKYSIPANSTIKPKPERSSLIYAYCAITMNITDDPQLVNYLGGFFDTLLNVLDSSSAL